MTHELPQAGKPDMIRIAGGKLVSRNWLAHQIATQAAEDFRIEKRERGITGGNSAPSWNAMHGIYKP